MTKISTEDLQHILTHTESLWDEIKQNRIFITGGTGFFGCWLLESFTYIVDQLNLSAKAVILTRNPDNFQQKCMRCQFYAFSLNFFFSQSNS